MVRLHDPGHVDVLVKDLGLEHGSSVQTTPVHEPLDSMQASGDRKLQDVCSVSEDRVDTACIVNEPCQRM